MKALRHYRILGQKAAGAKLKGYSVIESFVMRKVRQAIAAEPESLRERCRQAFEEGYHDMMKRS